MTPKVYSCEDCKTNFKSEADWIQHSKDSSHDSCHVYDLDAFLTRFIAA